MNKLHVDPDIRLAKTIHKDFYTKEKFFRKSAKKIFLQNWTYTTHASAFQVSGNILPVKLYPGFLDIPLALVNQPDKGVKCLSNVCTHRGNILIDHPGDFKKIQCRYHGRRFNLEGRMEFMPEFNGVHDFPSECDHLKEFGIMQWKDLIFVSLNSTQEKTSILKTLDEYVGFEDMQNFRYSEVHSKTYTVHAHWALYCENYLEGFHIPFVHKQLNEMLDYGKYEVLCMDKVILQIGYSDDPGICFTLPGNHALAGQHIAAFYFFLFPNVMLNFYPWGLSLNLVEPINKHMSKVHFKTFIKDQRAYVQDDMADLIDKVEREDESIVENVQKGVNSPFYKRGRYSPNRETGIHHFHSLICQAFAD